jgi:TetR/AcrR family transcriptional repressor of nem operon
MARAKTFERDAVLEKAMQVFWAQGYEATSMQDLVDAMGINRGSLYDTFGDKHALYMAALTRYRADSLAKMRAAMAGADTPRAALAAAFARIIGVVEKRGDRRGCFVCNTAVELGPHDTALAAAVADTFETIAATLEEQVSKGQETGEIRSDRDAGELARYLTANLNGLRVMAKAGQPVAALKQTAEIALGALDPV